MPPPTYQGPPACRCAHTSCRTAPAATPCRTHCSIRSRCCTGGWARCGRGADAAYRTARAGTAVPHARFARRWWPSTASSSYAVVPELAVPPLIYGVSDPHRAVENLAHGNESPEAVTADGLQACRRGAAAVVAVGGSARLGRSDLFRPVP